jgi:hypothetical protein
MMKNPEKKLNTKETLKTDFPKSASECGMEEAWGLGLLDDPQPPLKTPEDPYRFKHSRSDFTQS